MSNNNNYNLNSVAKEDYSDAFTIGSTKPITKVAISGERLNAFSQNNIQSIFESVLASNSDTIVDAAATTQATPVPSNTAAQETYQRAVPEPSGSSFLDSVDPAVKLDVETIL